jgi:hypothetical protein
MAINTPKIRHKFNGAWDEIGYLSGQMLYWFYQRNDRRRAARFSERLRGLLAAHDRNCEAILGASARAIVAEVAGDLWTAIQTRERELELIAAWQNATVPPETKYDPADVSDRMDLLAGLYWESGELEKAEALLLKSQRYCADLKIAFDGKKMLNELRREKRSRAKLAS